MMASFAAASRKVFWLAAFFAGLAVCVVGISYLQQASAFVLPDSCTTGVTVYNERCRKVFGLLSMVHTLRSQKCEFYVVRGINSAI
jgi:hypothetical protein